VQPFNVRPETEPPAGPLDPDTIVALLSPNITKPSQPRRPASARMAATISAEALAL
jgi:hypothetical protein